MTYEDRPSDEGIAKKLFKPTDPELADEREQIARGMVPDRWRLLRGHETERLGRALSIRLLELTPTEVELAKRRDDTWQLFHSSLTVSHTPDGQQLYYATHRNLGETLSRVVDIGAAEALLPPLDDRLPFHMTGREVVHGWLRDGIGEVLRPYESLTHQSLDDMPPITQEQFDAIVDFIATSGIPVRQPPAPYSTEGSHISG